MFLLQWREFPSAPCLTGKETWWQLASRFCWNRARPLHSSVLVSFPVGLRTYQHPGNIPQDFTDCNVFNSRLWVTDHTILRLRSTLSQMNYSRFCTGYTGRFIMFSVITNTYNKKTKGPTLMELFTATRKTEKVLCTLHEMHVAQ